MEVKRAKSIVMLQIDIEDPTSHRYAGIQGGAISAPATITLCVESILLLMQLEEELSFILLRQQSFRCKIGIE